MGESQRPSRAGRPPLPDPAGPPLTALIPCSSPGSPLSACKSRAPLGKPVPGNGKGDFNHGVGLLVLTQVCFVREFCPFSNNTTQRTLKKSPGCDRPTVSFHSFSGGRKVGKRKEREEKEKKPPDPLPHPTRQPRGFVPLNLSSSVQGLAAPTAPGGPALLKRAQVPPRRAASART